MTRTLTNWDTDAPVGTYYMHCMFNIITFTTMV